MSALIFIAAIFETNVIFRNKIFLDFSPFRLLTLLDGHSISRNKDVAAAGENSGEL